MVITTVHKLDAGRAESPISCSVIFIGPSQARSEMLSGEHSAVELNLVGPTACKECYVYDSFSISIFCCHSYLYFLFLLVFPEIR